MCYWTEKHSELNDRIGKYDIFNPEMKWTPFSALYADLQEYCSYLLEYKSAIQKANSKLSLLEDEQKQIDWVLQHEHLFEEVPCAFKLFFKKHGEFYSLEQPHSITLRGEHFQQLFTFITSYMGYHKSLIKKYNTYELDELKDALKVQNSQREQVDEVFSLRFHLIRRKALEEIGIRLPFYLIMKEGIF